VSECVVVDIEECVVGNTVCADTEACENTPGSYRCVCASGYTISGSLCVGLFLHYILHASKQ